MICATPITAVEPVCTKESAVTSYLRSLQNRLLDFLLPPQCILCHNNISEEARNTWKSRHRCDIPGSSFICPLCVPEQFFRSPQNAAQGTCHYCGEFSPELSNTIVPKEACCIVCSVLPYPKIKIRSLWYYDTKAEALLKRFKYGAKPILSKYLGAMLVELVRNEFASSGRTGLPWDRIVPIPSTSTALMHRGFSQTVLLSLQLSRSLNISLDRHALWAPKNRRPQASLPLAERLKNCELFFIASSRRVLGKKILLVDDLITTGATICQAAKTLIDAGASSVDVVSLARSPRFNKNRISTLLFGQPKK